MTNACIFVSIDLLSLFAVTSIENDGGPSSAKPRTRGGAKAAEMANGDASQGKEK